MSDDDGKTDGRRFRLTCVAIALVHLSLVGVLLFFSFKSSSRREDIVWVNPGSFGSNAATSGMTAADTPAQTPRPSEAAKEDSPAMPENAAEAASTHPPPPEPDRPEPLAEPSIPPEPVFTPTPAPMATPRPKPTPALVADRSPKPSPVPKPTPKASPRPSPKPKPSVTPRPSPSPKSSPKPEATPKEKEKEKEKKRDKPETEKPSNAEGLAKSKASPKANARNQSKSVPGSVAHTGDQETAKSAKEQTAVAAGPSNKSGAGGHGGGTGSGSGDSALAAYVGILTNRFQTAWNQPTSEMAMGRTMEVTVRLKVEADGKVTDFSIVEGSGNAVVDESVRQAGKSITRLPPPPNNQAFSAPVRFELGN